MNLIARTLFATGICAAAATGGTQGGAAPDALARYRWEARPILVFAPAGDPRMSEQTDRFAEDPAARRERDVVLIEIEGPSARANGTPIADAAALRDRFGVSDEAFAVILVGKDGGEKARSGAVTDPREFYDLIDGMPMRQREMRSSG